VPERPIIARAQAAGTRRLAVVAPLAEHDADGADAALAAAAPRTKSLAGLNQFLERAREQGAAMVSVAREQAEAIAQGAREQGFEVGYGEGIARAEAAVVERLALAEQLVAQVREAREEALASCERDLVELAFQIAEKVIRQRVVADPDATIGVLEHALRKAFVRDGLTVLCNPADLERLSGASELLQTRVGSLTGLSLIGDRRISPGGVVVRTDAGDIDATIESQLERLRDLMFDERAAA
jgi:flagellar assembly protein FliH